MSDEALRLEARRLVEAIDEADAFCKRQEEQVKAGDPARGYFAGKRSVAIYLKERARLLRALLDAGEK